METYLGYLTVFVALVAIALSAQAAVLYLAFTKLRLLMREAYELRREITDVYEHIIPILRNVEEVSATMKDGSRRLVGDISNLTRDVRWQVEKYDRFTDELANRLWRFTRVFLYPLGQTGAVVKKTVVRPVREATALLCGIKAALDFVAARGHGNRSRSASRLD
ncbi:MAG: DUF948 domain-containing protein [Candidatus Binatia bacterium]